MADSKNPPVPTINDVSAAEAQLSKELAETKKADAELESMYIKYLTRTTDKTKQSSCYRCDQSFIKGEIIFLTPDKIMFCVNCGNYYQLARGMRCKYSGKST